MPPAPEAMATLVIPIVFFLVLTGLLAGTASEAKPSIRRGCALAAFLVAALGYFATGMARSFELNVWYSGSAHKLLDRTVAALEQGRQAEVIREFKTMRDSLEVTYEHRGNFRDLAEKTSEALSPRSPQDPVSGDSR